MTDTMSRAWSAAGPGATAIEVEVVIEVPKGRFQERGSRGHIDFASPLPGPDNCGAVPTHFGLEGDLLDAPVHGPRLRFGARPLHGAPPGPVVPF